MLKNTLDKMSLMNPIEQIWKELRKRGFKKRGLCHFEKGC